MAQDKIFKLNGEIIFSRISKIDGEFVVFKRWDNLEGPEYTIPKPEVAKVVYTNGTEDVFDGNTDHIGLAHNNSVHDKIMANNTIISFAPILFTEAGWGVGLTYERSLDKNGWVSFELPLVTSFSLSSNANGAPSNLPMFYAAPGVKIYTNLNGWQKTKFAVGPSLVFAAGESQYVDNNNYLDPIYSTRSHVMMGAMINASANLFPTPQLYLGAEFGLGMTYVNMYDGVSKSVGALTRLSFNIGYRFHSGKKKTVVVNTTK
jgi:hypothetical protein